MIYLLMILQVFWHIWPLFATALLLLLRKPGLWLLLPALLPPMPAALSLQLHSDQLIPPFTFPMAAVSCQVVQLRLAAAG